MYRLLVESDNTKGAHVALCLENNVCAIGSSFEDVLSKWVQKFEAYKAVCAKSGRDPITDAVPAMEPLHTIWNQMSRFRLKNPFAGLNLFQAEIHEVPEVALVPPGTTSHGSWGGLGTAMFGGAGVLANHGAMA